MAWLHRSPVYHLARGAEWRVDDRWGDEVWVAPCGVVLASRLFLSREGTETDARRWGLRPCRRCFPTTAPL